MNHEPAGTDFGVVQRLPLPAALEELLRSLEPARGPRHGRMPSSRPLRQTHQRHDPEVLSQRLGFPVPTLSVLHAQGQLEYCSPPAAQVRAPWELGPQERGGVSIVHVPHEQVLDLPLEEAVRAGATRLVVSYGWGTPWPFTGVLPTRRDPASGDSTVVDVRGQLVTVQYQQSGRTRLAWAVSRPGAGYNVAVATGLRPVEAVGLVVACDLFGDQDAGA